MHRAALILLFQQPTCTPAHSGAAAFRIVTAAPPNPQAAYAGKPDDFGQPNDPLVGRAVGVIVFAGGWALYTPQGKLIGGLGVSGSST